MGKETRNTKGEGHTICSIIAGMKQQECNDFSMVLDKGKEVITINVTIREKKED